MPKESTAGEAMSISVIGPIDAGHGHVLYELEADGHPMTITFYRGLGSAGEGPWRAEIDFTKGDRVVGGQGLTRRAAFREACVMHADAIGRGVPLPAVDWSRIEGALAQKGAL